MTIPVDKQGHFLIGFAIVLVGGFANLFLAMSVCVLAGLAKEVYDKWTGLGTPEWADFLATVIGGVTAIFVHIILRTQT